MQKIRKNWFYVNNATVISYFHGEDVNYLKADRSYTEIMLKNKRRFVPSKPLCHCYKVLFNYVYPINDSLALNLAEIAELTKATKILTFRDGSTLELTCEQYNAYYDVRAKFARKVQGDIEETESTSVLLCFIPLFFMKIISWSWEIISRVWNEI